MNGQDFVGLLSLERENLSAERLNSSDFKNCHRIGCCMTRMLNARWPSILAEVNSCHTDTRYCEPTTSLDGNFKTNINATCYTYKMLAELKNGYIYICTHNFPVYEYSSPLHKYLMRCRLHNWMP
jgi:hypothetical protein